MIWTGKGDALVESRVQENRLVGRHAVREFRRAVSKKISIQDIKINCFAAEFERWMTVRKRRTVKETKSFRLHCVQKTCEWMHGTH